MRSTRYALPNEAFKCFKGSAVIGWVFNCYDWRTSLLPLLLAEQSAAIHGHILFFTSCLKPKLFSSDAIAYYNTARNILGLLCLMHFFSVIKLQREIKSAF